MSQSRRGWSSWRWGILVLVYGCLVLQEVQAKMTAPAPWRTEHRIISQWIDPTVIERNKIDSTDKSVGATVGEGLKSVTHPPVVRTWGGWGSTCDILDRSHRRTGAGPAKAHQRLVLRPHSSSGWRKVHSRRSPRFRTCCSTCTLCTASGTSWQPPSLWEWTADRMDGLQAGRRI